MTRAHGTPIRGIEHVASSRLTEGRFGRMFRSLPPASFEPDHLKSLAAAMISKAEPQKPDGAADEDENSLIPAGYTYFGQFIDHDLTFDPASSLERQNDPDALVDFRTPRFDLDCVYGRGPDDQPYLYEQSGPFAGVALALGSPVSTSPERLGPDLPRFGERALIGDPRNDENLIVSQLQSTMLRFHNAVVKHLSAQAPSLTGGDLFTAAQEVVRWHYQWVVLHDFLPRIVGGRVNAGQAIVDGVLRREAMISGIGTGGKQLSGVTYQPDLRFYRPEDTPFMPVEFSVAAYRFGHSMVRPSYFINDFVKKQREQTSPAAPRIPIFTGTNGPLDNLNGFRRLPAEWGFQWKFFFPMRAHGANRDPQASYKIDSDLVNPLGGLPTPIGGAMPSLALRNLLRGLRLGLPSGQNVANAIGVVPVGDTQLLDDKNASLTKDGRPPIASEAVAAFRGNTPLWYYILRESEVLCDGQHLGPVGARIVAEVFAGLIWFDKRSYLRQRPLWTPTLPKSADGQFGMAELIKFGGASI